MNLKKQATTAFKVLFAVGLVYWLVKTDRFKFSELKPFLEPVNFLIGFALVGINIFFLSERWRLLMRAHEQKAKWWPTWKLTLKGIFFNFAVPGGVGGDVVKAYYLQQDIGSTRAAAFSSALIDRIVGLYALISMAMAALVYEKLVVTESNQLLDELFLWVALLFGALTLGTTFLTFFKWPKSLQKSEGLVGKVYRFAEACQYYFKRPKILWSAFFITVIAQMVTIFFFRWAFQDVLNEPVSWSLLLFVLPVGFMAMAIPITPAGVGVGQAVFFFLFQRFSNNEVLGGSAVITALQMLQFAWGILGAYYYLTRKSRVPLTVTESPN